MREDLTIKEVLWWILENCEDTNAMDKINKSTFPYTSKYAKYVQPPKDETSEDDGVLNIYKTNF